MKLSIIVPVYNEEKTILDVLTRLQTINFGLDYEVIVVDDGSTDKTKSILQERIIPSSKNIKLIFLDKNSGKGAALRRGFQVATGDIMAVQDADLEYQPQDIAPLVKPILEGRSRVVYGARFLRHHQPLYKLFYTGNRLISKLFGLIYGTPINDPWTGHKVFHRDALNNIHLTSQRFDLEIELTAKWLRAKEKIMELPISYQGRTYQEGKKIKWTDGIKALWAIIKYRFV
jgi:glycosyltransferase involved in cell wall biosynthesis